MLVWVVYKSRLSKTLDLTDIFAKKKTKTKRSQLVLIGVERLFLVHLTEYFHLCRAHFHMLNLHLAAVK